MSKAVLVCLNHNRAGSHSIHDSDLRNSIALLNERLTPDNIVPKQPWVSVTEGLCIAVLNPADSIEMVGTSICLGHMLEKPNDWWKPEGGIPDGSYAIYRSDGKSVELLTDVVASRSIWYAQTDDIFVASSSQRAIVAFLGNFYPSTSAVAWMLSSGTLGPHNSWDQRIQLLEGDSRLLLDCTSWERKIERKIVNFAVRETSAKEHRARFVQELNDTFDHFDIEYSKWALTLSGGYDSRAILMMLKGRAGLRCITWGLRASVDDEKNDAYIAKLLAQHFCVNYEYHETDFSEEPVEAVLNRYLVAGEGRVDFVPGYMDGFKIWKTLFEHNIDGIIRGDECFGWKAVNSTSEAMRSVGILRLSDYSDRIAYLENELEQQIVPQDLCRREGESIATWRDRLYHEFRIPVILSALNDLKSPYVEITNPLLSRALIECVRAQPDDLRTDKKLFKEVVSAMSPRIGFSNRQATDSPRNILHRQELVEYLREELSSGNVARIVPGKLADLIMEGLAGRRLYAGRGGKVRAARRLIPKQVRNAVKSLWRRDTKVRVDVNTIAFRAFIVLRMHQLLEADSVVFRVARQKVS